MQGCSQPVGPSAGEGTFENVNLKISWGQGQGGPRTLLDWLLGLQLYHNLAMPLVCENKDRKGFELSKLDMPTIDDSKKGKGLQPVNISSQRCQLLQVNLHHMPQA